MRSKAVSNFGFKSTPGASSKRSTFRRISLLYQRIRTQSGPQTLTNWKPAGDTRYRWWFSEENNFSECLAPNSFVYISSSSDRAFLGGFGRFFLLLNSLKRSVLVRKNSFSSCQRCRHNVELRAEMCPFKQCNLGARSLLSWHPTHTYLWRRLSVCPQCVVVHRHGHAEWLRLCQQKYSSETGSVKFTLVGGI